MTQLEKAKSKLNRIRNEQQTLKVGIRQQHDLIPFGQPNIIGRPNIYKKVNRMYDKSFQLMKEEKNK